MRGFQTDGEFVGRGIPGLGAGVVGVTVNDGCLGPCKSAVVVGAGGLTALGQVQLVRPIKRHGRDHVAVGRTRDVDFKTRIAGKATVCRETDRPNRRAFGNRIIKPPAFNSQCHDTAAGVGIAPGIGIFD